MKLPILLICTALAAVGGDVQPDRAAPEKRVVRHLGLPSFWDWPDSFRSGRVDTSTTARKPKAPVRNQCSGLTREVQRLSSDIQNQKNQIQRQEEEIRRQNADINTQAGEIQRQRAEIHKQTGEIQRQRAEIHKQTGEIQRQRAEIHKQTGEIQRQHAEIHKQKNKAEALMIVAIVVGAGTVAGFAGFWWLHCRKKVILAEQHSRGLQKGSSDQKTGKRRSETTGRRPGHKLPTLARHDSENSLYEPFTMP